MEDEEFYSCPRNPRQRTPSCRSTDAEDDIGYLALMPQDTWAEDSILFRRDDIIVFNVVQGEIKQYKKEVVKLRDCPYV